MTNCTKLLCKDYNTERCNNCEYKRTFLEYELKKIDKKKEENKNV